MQPAKLLKDLCMVWISVQHTPVCQFGIVILLFRQRMLFNAKANSAYIFLLLMDVTDLKPNILFCQWGRWNGNNISETLELVNIPRSLCWLQVTYLQTLLVLLLLLVNYAKTEINFISLFKIRLHSHDLRKCFLSVFKRPISII